MIFGETVSAKQVVKAQKQECYRIGAEQYLNVLLCIRKRGFTGSEEVQYNIQIEICDPSRQDADYETKITTVCRISAACSYCLRPRQMEVSVVPPIPTSVLKAIRQFIIGKVTASPEIASVPTPFPMNILSIRLYSDTAAILMMAGIEY